MRKSAWILTGIATLLLAASGVLRLAVYPHLAQIPSDVDVTLQYAGTADMLDAAAVESGDLAHALLTDVPVTVDRRVRVVDTSGRTAVFSDLRELSDADGVVLLDVEERWAVDRRTFEERPAPDGSGVAPHEGLVIGWPLSPDQEDYPFWDAATGTRVTAVYAGTETVEGRTAHLYTVHAEGPLNETAAAAFPEALPKEAVSGIAAALPEDRRPDPAALDALPDTVPLTYAATTDLQVWVDSTTGTVLDTTQHQTYVAQVAAGPEPVALAPVSDLDVRLTPESVRSQADDAASAARALWLLRTAGPLALLTAAVVLYGVVAWNVWRARRRADA
ncbi:porin PorA family protein [Streptomyces specialis]|uniref:porin PorA family protein n=1 Tax=Streptomyces specialis TaxID=498367 RepID=UPI00073F0A77|nr:porin PorA family protein [Streptomyces specialis]